MKKVLPFILIGIPVIAAYFVLQMPSEAGNGKPLLMLACAIPFIGGVAMLLFNSNK
jgi:hypothetical protein